MRARPARPTSNVEPAVQAQVRGARFGANVAPMSASGLLLRVVLMLSLLLNGLNAAMAGPMMMAMATPAAAEDAPAPPCHGQEHAALHGAPAESPAQAPDDGEHCRIKDCLRNCLRTPASRSASRAARPMNARLAGSQAMLQAILAARGDTFRWISWP